MYAEHDRADGTHQKARAEHRQRQHQRGERVAAREVGLGDRGRVVAVDHEVVHLQEVAADDAEHGPGFGFLLDCGGRGRHVSLDKAAPRPPGAAHGACHIVFLAPARRGPRRPMVRCAASAILLRTTAGCVNASLAKPSERYLKNRLPNPLTESSRAGSSASFPRTSHASFTKPFPLPRSRILFRPLFFTRPFPPRRANGPAPRDGEMARAAGRRRARRTSDGPHRSAARLVPAGEESASRAGYSRVSRAARRNVSSSGVQSSSSGPPARWNSGCHCTPTTNGARR